MGTSRTALSTGHSTTAVLDQSVFDLPSLKELAVTQVGRGNLPAVLEEIRRSMVMEGLRQSRGNITQAAHVLGLTRQAVQQMITSLSLKQWILELRNTDAEAEPFRASPLRSPAP